MASKKIWPLGSNELSDRTACCGALLELEPHARSGFFRNQRLRPKNHRIAGTLGTPSPVMPAWAESARCMAACHAVAGSAAAWEISTDHRSQRIPHAEHSGQPVDPTICFPPAF
jgi:hypothetical protein